MRAQMRLKVAGTVLIGLSAAALSACSEATQQRAGAVFEPPALETQTLQRSVVAQESAFDGTLEALYQSTVASETNARVIALPFDVNDYVEKGEVLVRFRDTEPKAQLSSAEAALREAQARYTETQQEYERAQKLYAKGLIAKAQMDSSTAAYQAAKARVNAAKAGRKQAVERLEHTVVRAPYSGIVVKRHIEVGETATVGRPLMTGLSLEHLRAVVDIPQQHIGPLRKHRKARVILADNRSVEATELRIPPNADPVTHTFRVLVSLPPGDHGVFPGSLVKVAFLRGESEQLLMPAAALVRRGEVTGAYVIAANGRIGLRYLRVGSPTFDGRVPVLAGMVADEKVAMDPIAAGIAYKQQLKAVQGNAP